MGEWTGAILGIAGSECGPSGQTPSRWGSEGCQKPNPQVVSRTVGVPRQARKGDIRLRYRSLCSH